MVRRTDQRAGAASVLCHLRNGPTFFADLMTSQNHGRFAVCSRTNQHHRHQRGGNDEHHSGCQPGRTSFFVDRRCGETPGQFLTGPGQNGPILFFRNGKRNLILFSQFLQNLLGKRLIRRRFVRR